MGFSRQEYWSGLPFPSLGDLPNPGIEPRSPALQADVLTSEPPGKLRIVLDFGNYRHISLRASLVVQWQRIHLPMHETQVRSLGWEDPLEKKMATQSSILAWEILWTEEPGRLESKGSPRVRHDLVTKQQQSQ